MILNYSIEVLPPVIVESQNSSRARLGDTMPTPDPSGKDTRREKDLKGTDAHYHRSQTWTSVSLVLRHNPKRSST